VSKADEYRRLTKVDTTMNDDGTNIQFVLHATDGEPARFHTGAEGLSMLLKIIKDRTRVMAERLNQSGAAAKYRAGIFDLAPDRALSIQVGVESPSEELHLAIQTEDGAFTRILVPTDVALQLANAINRVKPNLDPASKPKARH
jgi:hypothetical protein